MANARQQPSIWNQMAYTPPRGPCSQKLSLLTTCPCFRFMIHPLKASTSFDCDGCGHHASYHRMQNEHDEETARRWKDEEQRKFRDGERERWHSVEEVIEEVAPKRKRIEALPSTLEKGKGNGIVGRLREDEEAEGFLEVVEERTAEKGAARAEAVEVTVGVGSKRRRR